MSSEKAFPLTIDPDLPRKYTNQGMTLRDYFAAKAMQGMMASEGEENGYWSSDEKSQNMVCVNAYSIADRMLAARETKEAK
jgi:hypothetical protein